MVVQELTNMTEVIVHQGDCLEVLKGMPDNSVHAVVTDPPYGLSFMGKKWDYDVPSEDVWRECLRVLKPGGHLLAFAGTRTQHRMAVRIEDAGFEIRDMIAWVYGSGFPKSHNVANAIDKHHGAGNRGHAISSGSKLHPTTGEPRANGEQLPKYEARTEAGKGWEGWGTALKPALEPITLARKPLIGTVAQNVLQHGTGAMNVDGCRVGAETITTQAKIKGSSFTSVGSAQGFNGCAKSTHTGRWPANFIHNGGEEVLELFPVTGASKATPRNNGEFKSVAKGRDLPHITHGHDDQGGSAARFFYCPKASKRDRDEGLEGFAQKAGDTWGSGIGHASGDSVSRANTHPTVKPTDLMRYLVRLVTPAGGTVLDPFTGSGSTGKAAVMEGFHFIGIEREPEYVRIAQARIAAVQPELV